MMPVKIWKEQPVGLVSEIVTGWDTVITGEEHRPQAEELDRALDVVLDKAIERVAGINSAGTPKEFIRAWAVGKALREVGFSPEAAKEIPALRNEKVELLWKALASKCSTGARSDGTIEVGWRDLRPHQDREVRREGKRLDYFGMCRWLAEDEFHDAAETFGGSIHNVWQMMERRNLQAEIFRRSFLDWLSSKPADERRKLTDTKTFPKLMKAAVGRWPAKGPGAAKQPVHYQPQQLRRELEFVLGPVAAAETGRGGD